MGGKVMRPPAGAFRSGCRSGLRHWILAALLGALVSLPFRAAAQVEEKVTVRGTVHDSRGLPIAGATVEAEGLPPAAVSNEKGVFQMRLGAGRHSFRIARPGFHTARLELEISADLEDLDFVLAPQAALRETVVVQAIRAGEAEPATTTDLEQPEIEKRNFGQEMPFLLKDTPSVVHSSDSGNGAGYCYFSIRGIAQTRINMTLDGVPLNEPEDSGVYFSNFGDFTRTVESIQIQRGVGTSTVGSASFGGSISFQSADPKDKPAFSAQLGAGSFGSYRGSLALDSGRRRGGLAFKGQLSLSTTDGFREHSGADQASFYYGATRQADRSYLKVSGFSGRTRTGLAYLAAESSILEGNLRFNPLAPEERDGFGQDFLQAQYTREVSPAASVSVQGYYNGVQGWIRIRNAADGLLQQYGVNGQMTGALVTAHYQRGPWTAAWAAHFSRFSRQHTLDTLGGSRLYRNTGFKEEANTFFKAGGRWNRFSVYGDLQVRWTRFRYEGSLRLGPVRWAFFNPKIGARWQPVPLLGLYASIGRAVREPTRNDMLAGEDNATVAYDLRAVRPEELLDLEAGLEGRGRNLQWRSNLYAMEFRNEIAQTGELSEIGLPLRRNVGRSYRRGWESELTWKPVRQLLVRNATGLSRNRIREWVQQYNVFDGSGAWVEAIKKEHRGVIPLLTPSAVVNQTVEWLPASRFAVSVTGRYVSSSRLDNTGQTLFHVPAYGNVDLGFRLDLPQAGARIRPHLRLDVLNLLNRRQYAGGYSYLFYERDSSGADRLAALAYFYPLAGRALFLNLDFSW